ncbi:FkbM family methyltransferase [Erythrobacter sp. SCSIO 43205]|uniref:FkbM family methyltransferase n=1 Tax=Erythrobacter sp. SCSIO 43205 TaxID=2779361 RepID=UPI001CAA12A3|nr:FkbM family methyltransferase [Erythrobacter sp. SCSIO 43205]UAB78968.1 FkbM family methyltransferase [Erythrobacter sp. SCSIO 43205]
MRTHKLKSFFEATLGNKFWLEPSSDLDMVRGFVRSLTPVDIGIDLIRIGSDTDGGYLVPDDLDGIEACLSPGVSTEVGFDLVMAEAGLHVVMADASVSGPPVSHERFHFFQKFLAVHEDERNMRFDSLVTEASKHTAGDLLLQMDIEGAEYAVLLDASDEALQRCRIILLECHNLTCLFGRQNSQIITATFQKLLRHFNIVHLHPNNVCPPTVRDDVAIPPVMEFSLVRKDRGKAPQPNGGVFPHPLDRDNVPSLPPLVLPESWQ